jgi:archaellum biogenesis ATPase FlaH
MLHGQPGLYTLAEAPQRPSIEEESFGTGWEQLDRILRFYLGQLIVVTGLAGSGKSTFLMNLACNIAKKFGIRSFFYAPENEGHLRERLQAIWKNDETFEVFSREQCFLRSAIRNYNDPPHTIDYVIQQAQHVVHKNNVDFVVIDPWNELERVKPRDQLMTDYIGESLMILKDFCRTNKVFLAIAAHPTKAVCENGGREVQLSDIEGSMNWWNKCDNGLVVVRDTAAGVGKVISKKVREIGAGSLGKFDFYVTETGSMYPKQDDDLWVGQSSNDEPKSTRSSKRSNGRTRHWQERDSPD